MFRLHKNRSRSVGRQPLSFGCALALFRRDSELPCGLVRKSRLVAGSNMRNGGEVEVRGVCAARRRAALLLEVIVSLAIMVAALGLIGAQLHSGLKMTAQAETATRAAELSDRLLALLELDPQLAQRIFQERKIDGDFGTEFPGYHWRANVDKTDVDGLGLVTLEILFQGDPERPTDIDGARVVRHLHLLKADPGRIDLGRDFGVPEEALAVMGPQMSMIPGLDPAQFDPQALAALPPEQLFAVLAQLLPILQQAGIIPPGLNFDPSASPDDLAQLIGTMIEAQGRGAPGGLPGMGGTDGIPGLTPGGGLPMPGTGGGGAVSGPAGGNRQPQTTPNRGRGGSTTPVAPRNNSGVRGSGGNADGGNPAGTRSGAGTRRGGAGGAGSSGATLDDLRRMSPGAGGATGTTTGRNTGTRGRSGGNSGAGGAGGGSGGQRYTIEDLMRMRDEANRSRGGR